MLFLDNFCKNSSIVFVLGLWVIRTLFKFDSNEGLSNRLTVSYRNVSSIWRLLFYYCHSLSILLVYFSLIKLHSFLSRNFKIHRRNKSSVILPIRLLKQWFWDRLTVSFRSSFFSTFHYSPFILITFLLCFIRFHKTCHFFKKCQFLSIHSIFLVLLSFINNIKIRKAWEPWWILLKIVKIWYWLFQVFKNFILLLL